MTLAVGNNHSIFVDRFGVVWSCGSNKHGELGVGDKNKREIPTKIKTLPRIATVSAGNSFSLYLDGTGTVWSCGMNELGQLGIGSVVNQTRPVKIELLPKIEAIHCLENSSLFLDSNGDVFCCGSNINGELGVASEEGKKLEPTKILNLPKIQALSGGKSHSLFLDIDGNVWAAGNNGNGQLGTGNLNDSQKPVKVLNLPKIKSISAGAYVSWFVDFNGNVWGCGANGKGELGFGDSRARLQPSKLSAALQDLTIKDPVRIISVGGNEAASIFLTETGSVFTCGSNNRKTPTLVGGIPKMSKICPGHGFRFMCVDEEGNVWGWGQNGSGQLGVGDSNHRNQPVMVMPLREITAVNKENEALLSRMCNALSVGTPSQDLMQLIAENSIEKFLAAPDFVKEQIFKGTIPLSNWSERWQTMHTKNNEHESVIDTKKRLLMEQQQRLEEIKREIESAEKDLVVFARERLVTDFFDKILENISTVEEAMMESFHSKLENPQLFTNDDVCLFLNLCAIPKLDEVLEIIQKRNVDGENLILHATISEVECLGVTDILAVKKIEFYGKLLGRGLYMQEDKLQKNTVCRHLSTENTLNLLKEYRIDLDTEMIKKNNISIGQLIFFKSKDFESLFNLSQQEAFTIIQKLLTLRIGLESFLFKE